MYNNGVNDTSLNMNFEIFTAIQKLLIYVKLNLPENAIDRKYQKEFLRTVCDLEKIMNGNNGNFISSSMMAIISSSIDIDLKLPFKRVNFN